MKNFTFKIFIAAFLLAQVLSPFPVLSADTSQFTTSLTTFGFDGIAPSIPANLSATAVSPSQIDLSWDASTDNVAVEGYRIFRDSIFIATTSGTTYSDIGLSPETTYAYAVEAFDQSFNLSGQSAPASATTLAVPPQPTPTPPTGGGGRGGGRAGGQQLIIYSVEIIPGLTEATIRFETNMPTQGKVFWGKTPDFEAGSLSALVYGTSHEVLVSGLQSGTTYFVRIAATNSLGVTVYADRSATTLSPAVLYPLPNPSNFQAVPDKDRINLSWQNPRDPRFDAVRIVRSETFFPKDQFDGVPIYEGPGESFVDRDVAVGSTYYYAIFSKGKSGEFSSGALAKARIAPPGETVIVPISADPFANLPESQKVDARIASLALSDFEFIQENRQLPLIGNTVAINGSKNLTVRLKYEKAPEILKTIAFTLADPENPSKVFPFLLRINQDKTYYDATIGALGRSGRYAMSVVILDYENQGLARLRGILQALVFSAVPVAVGAGFDPAGFLFLLLLILIILIIAALLRRHHRRAAGNMYIPNV